MKTLNKILLFQILTIAVYFYSGFAVAADPKIKTEKIFSTVNCLEKYSNELRDLHTQQLLKIADYKESFRLQIFTGEGTSVSKTSARSGEELIQEYEQVRKLLINEGIKIKALIDAGKSLLKNYDTMKSVEWKIKLMEDKVYNQICGPGIVFDSYEEWKKWSEIYYKAHPKEEKNNLILLDEEEKRSLQFTPPEIVIDQQMEQAYNENYSATVNNFKKLPSALPLFIDHRNEFSKIKFQGEYKTFPIGSCTSYAVASVMEQKLPGVDISERSLYSIFTGQNPEMGMKNMGSNLLGISLDILKKDGALQESSCPWDTTQFAIPNDRLARNSCDQNGLRYLPSEFSIHAFLVGDPEDPLVSKLLIERELQRLKFDQVIETLIFQHRFPIVAINENYIIEKRDWIKTSPKMNGGHVIVIVGYGVEVSPFTLKKEPYFLVRNSGTKLGVHQKISKNDLYKKLLEIVTIEKVTSAR